MYLLSKTVQGEPSGLCVSQDQQQSEAALVFPPGNPQSAFIQMEAPGL